MKTGQETDRPGDTQAGRHDQEGQHAPTTGLDSSLHIYTARGSYAAPTAATTKTQLQYNLKRAQEQKKEKRTRTSISSNRDIAFLLRSAFRHACHSNTIGTGTRGGSGGGGERLSSQTAVVTVVEMVVVDQESGDHKEWRRQRTVIHARK